MTPYRTLIDTDTLHRHLSHPDWAVVDCRFSLADPEQGRTQYRQGHVPGAVYAHLDDDLSGPVVPGRTGRHPLPDPGALSQRVGSWGIGPGVQVVAYDDLRGAIAARLWWLLGWLGHDDVAVLDGGWAAWVAAGLPQGTRAATPRPRSFEPRIRSAWTVDAQEAARVGAARDATLLDARTGLRYRGEEEPIDAVAGHVPGAISAPWPDNVGHDGRFLPAAALRARFDGLLEGTDPTRAVCYCGSGVTANHDVLAMVHAGLPRPRLYPGSWSEWITDPARPVATGDG